jgi:hypothetical protein
MEDSRINLQSALYAVFVKGNVAERSDSKTLFLILKA